MAKEKYSQIGYIAVTESAAATLTFNGLSVFSNVLSNSAMIIHRVAYHFRRTDYTTLVADQDQVIFGLAGDDQMSSVRMDDAEVYDYNDVISKHDGTAGSAQLIFQPKVNDFGMLPGGGLIVPADRVFAFVQGVSVAAAFVLTCRFHFTIEELTPADYLELAQAMRVLK